jgi:GNAT superfamily N-acetyltransferase
MTDFVEGLKIRKVRKRDLLELSRVYAQIYRKHDVGERWSAPAAQKMLGWYLKSTPDLAYLAEYKGKIVGGFFVVLKPYWDGNHLIEGEIFVHPGYQKRGIGSMLMERVLARSIKKHNAIVWEPFVFSWDYPLKWYRSLGFKKAGNRGLISIVGNTRKVLKGLEVADNDRNLASP